MSEEVEDKEVELAKIESRRAAFDRSPMAFVTFDVLHKVLGVIFWIVFWSLIVQCTCDGCVWEPINLVNQEDR